MRTITLVLLSLSTLVGCPGSTDKPSADTAGGADTADTAPEVDTDTGDSGDTEQPCADLPPLDLGDLFADNLWSGSWNGQDDVAWFRFRASGSFQGFALEPSKPAREDYEGSWTGTADLSAVTLEYIDDYPTGSTSPLDVTQVIHPSLTSGTNDEGCEVPVLEFEWSDNNAVEGLDGLTATMSLFLR